MKYRFKGISRLSRPGMLFVLFAAAAVVSGTGAAVLQIFSAELFGWESTVYREEYSLPFKSYLNFNVTNIPVYFDIYDGDEIKILYSNETALLIEENEYSYTISQDADFAFSLYSLDFLDYSATVLLPDRVYREVTVTSASGDIEFLRVYARSLDITSRSGNIKVTEAVGNMRLKTVYGSIDAEFISFDDSCLLESESGNITVAMPENRLVWLEFLTETGSFTSDFFNEEYKNRKGDFFKANHENAKKLSVSTKSGDLLLMSCEE